MAYMYELFFHIVSKPRSEKHQVIKVKKLEELNSKCQVHHQLPMSKRDPCMREACEIQKCLQAKNYREDLCLHTIQNLIKCCSKLEPGQSVCCSGFTKQVEEYKQSQNNNKK